METSLQTTSTAAATSGALANIPEVIDTFIKQQDVKPASRQLYGRVVGGFFGWVGQTHRVTSELSLEDIVAWKEHLFASGKSSLTVAAYINAVRRFYSWTEANKYYPNIAKGVRAPKRKQEFKKQPLSVRKVAELLSHERDTQSARDYAIINLMARTGLRCVEVSRANIGDITFIGEDNTRVLMVQGKGADTKDNFVKLSDAAYYPIKAYLESCRKGEPEGSPLFKSESNHTTVGGRLTTRSISAIAKNGLRSVGLDNKAFSAHSLRHTAGTNILRAGGTLEQAQMTLRHANPATTEIYARMALNERRITNGGEDLLDQLYNTALN